MAEQRDPTPADYDLLQSRYLATEDPRERRILTQAMIELARAIWGGHDGPCLTLTAKIDRDTRQGRRGG